MLIFTRSSPDSLSAVNTFLGYYQAVSGQQVNVHKSSFFISSRVSNEQVQLVSEMLGFQKHDLPFTYLGAPIYRGRSRCVLLDGILGKTMARLWHWSTKLLSAREKLVLIERVLASLPMYLLQVLKPPKAILLRLGRICNTFLWDQNSENRRIRWWSWDKVCFPI